MVLTNSQYEQLMSQYYKRQLRTKQISQDREREVYEAVPAFFKLDQRIRQLSLLTTQDGVWQDLTAMPEMVSSSSKSVRSQKKRKYC